MCLPGCRCDLSTSGENASVWEATDSQERMIEWHAVLKGSAYAAHEDGRSGRTVVTEGGKRDAAHTL